MATPLRDEVETLRSIVARIRLAMPATFYADLPLEDRVAALVRSWKVAYTALETYEKEFGA